MKILIAEDDPVSKMVLQKTLEKWGHHVLAAEDGLEALNTFQSNEVDMIITDWMMPEIDGIELCRRVREMDKKKYIYTIILTAKDQTSDVVEGFEAGADDYLVKPFKAEELKSRINAGIRILDLENRLLTKNRLLEEANNKITDDLEYAANVQKSLLPNNLPEIEGVDICWEFHPCDQLGGDMINVMRLDETRYGIYILDVSGHGVPAALFSVSLSRVLSENRDILKSRIASPPYYIVTPPKEVLESLNRQFPMNLTTRQYFTIIYGILDLSRHTFQWSGAGHPLPILNHNNGANLLGDASGPPIGFFENPGYEENMLKLDRNHRVLFCSDGIIEATNQFDEQFTIDRIRQTLDSTRDLELKDVLSNLISEVGEWTAGRGGPNDDITLLGLEITGR